jgi:serine/threonine protein phosphatase PrpC
MEDEAILFDCFSNDENLGYFAVFDGHGGRQTVDFVKDHLHDVS